MNLSLTAESNRYKTPISETVFTIPRSLMEKPKMQDRMRSGQSVYGSRQDKYKLKEKSVVRATK